MSTGQAGAILFVLIALGLTILVALSVYEAWTLLTSKAPITLFARLGLADHPRFGFVVAMIIGLLGGHLFWR